MSRVPPPKGWDTGHTPSEAVSHAYRDTQGHAGTQGHGRGIRVRNERVRKCMKK